MVVVAVIPRLAAGYLTLNFQYTGVPKQLWDLAESLPTWKLQDLCTVAQMIDTVKIRRICPQ